MAGLQALGLAPTLALDEASELFDLALLALELTELDEELVLALLALRLLGLELADEPGFALLELDATLDLELLELAALDWLEPTLLEPRALLTLEDTLDFALLEIEVDVTVEAALELSTTALEALATRLELTAELDCTSTELLATELLVSPPPPTASTATDEDDEDGRSPPWVSTTTEAATLAVELATAAIEFVVLAPVKVPALEGALPPPPPPQALRHKLATTK